MGKCYVTAVINAKAGMEDKVKAEILANIPNVRAEQGCVRYDLHVLDKDGARFMLYEIWEDRDALNVHSKAPHMTAYRERTKDMVAGPAQVEIWSGVDVAECCVK